MDLNICNGSSKLVVTILSAYKVSMLNVTCEHAQCTLTNYYA